MRVAAAGRQVGWLALALALAAAVAGTARMLAPAPDFTDRLRDDAYYEFAWAANVAAGVGPTVSDGVTTSGVQLLWSLGLAAVAAVFGAGALPLVAPWLGFLLHCAAAALIAASGRDRLAAACAALCWLGHPLLVRESQNGQETALAALMLLLLWRARRAGEVRFLVVGALATFARSDLLLLLGPLSLARHGASWWRGLPTPALVALLHFAVNAWLGGGVVPDAAAPMAWLWHENHAATAPTLAETAATWWWYGRPVLLGGPYALASAAGFGMLVFAAVRPLWPRALRAVPAVAVVVAAALGVGDLLVPAWAAALLLVLPAPGRRRLRPELAALLLGGALLVAVHWAVRWYPRDYYVAPLAVAGTAALLHLGRLRWLLVAFAAGQLADLPRVGAEPLAPQARMALACARLAAVLPAGERVGCFNSGLVTFAADVLQRGTPAQREVLNLDGVVDARAFAALGAGRLGAWLDAEGIRFVLDDPAQFATDPRRPHANGRWIAPDFDPDRDLVEVARFVAPADTDDEFRLYWRRRGAPPPRATAARDLGPWRGARCVLWPAAAGEQLELELGSGARRPVVTAERATTVVVAVPAVASSTGRLFVRGRPAPVLVLPRD